MKPELSIIIPLSSNENAWQALAQDLQLLPSGVEIIWVCPLGTTFNATTIPGKNICVLYASPGRASQLNAGARVARKSFLWFLHADTRFTQNALDALYQAIETAPHCLHYFNLHYYDGPKAMRYTSQGIWLRSHCLKMPFGDQGFCLSKTLFNKLGGYEENASYGEDHLLVWQAHEQRVKLRCTGALLSTSARKYIDKGWLYTTCLHQFLWLKQASQQLLVWIKQRLFR